MKFMNFFGKGLSFCCWNYYGNFVYSWTQNLFLVGWNRPIIIITLHSVELSWVGLSWVWINITIRQNKMLWTELHIYGYLAENMMTNGTNIPILDIKVGHAHFNMTGHTFISTCSKNTKLCIMTDLLRLMLFSVYFSLLSIFVQQNKSDQ